MEVDEIRDFTRFSCNSLPPCSSCNPTMAASFFRLTLLRLLSLIGWPFARYFCHTNLDEGALKVLKRVACRESFSCRMRQSFWERSSSQTNVRDHSELLLQDCRNNRNNQWTMNSFVHSNLPETRGPAMSLGHLGQLLPYRMHINVWHVLFARKWWIRRSTSRAVFRRLQLKAWNRACDRATIQDAPQMRGEMDNGN